MHKHYRNTVCGFYCRCSLVSDTDLMAFLTVNGIRYDLFFHYLLFTVSQKTLLFLFFCSYVQLFLHNVMNEALHLMIKKKNTITF